MQDSSLSSETSSLETRPSQALFLGVWNSDLDARTEVTLVEKSLDDSSHIGCGKTMIIGSVRLACLLKAQHYEPKLLL